MIASTGSTVNNYLFAGEWFDPALGVYYNRARYYDERRGRFWTADTGQGRMRDPQSLHKYPYADVNPVNRVDPTGHDSLIDISLSVALYSGLTSMALTTAFGAYVAVGTMLNIPKDFKTQIMKPPSAALVGTVVTANIGRVLNDLGVGETSVGAGAVVGLQFLSFGFGFEALLPSTLDRVWTYGYAGAFYSLPFGSYGANGMSESSGVTVWPGVNLDFVDASFYTGFVWNLKNSDDYKGPFYCTSGSVLLGVMGVHLAPNATLCTAANGVFSVTTDPISLGSSSPKGSAGSSLTIYDFEGEFLRRRTQQ